MHLKAGEMSPHNHGDTATTAAWTSPETQMEAAGVTILESCHSVWVFDQEHMRFRRVPHGIRLDIPAAKADWTRYYRLDIDVATGAFTVDLTEDGTHILRSWVHRPSCAHCETGKAT